MTFYIVQEGYVVDRLCYTGDVVHVQEGYVVDRLWYTGDVVHVQEGYVVDRLWYTGDVVYNARVIYCRQVVLYR